MELPSRVAVGSKARKCKDAAFLRLCVEGSSTDPEQAEDAIRVERLPDPSVPRVSHALRAAVLDIHNPTVPAPRLRP